MEMLKGITAVACFLSLALSAASQLPGFERFSSRLRPIFVSLLVLCILKPICSGQLKFSSLFTTNDSDLACEVSYANEVIDEAVRLQTQKQLEESACGLLSEYGVDFKDLSFSVNIDDEKRISISKVSLYSDSPLTADYVLRKIFGDNAEIEVFEYE